jgi:hypothetical protein
MIKMPGQNPKPGNIVENIRAFYLSPQKKQKRKENQKSWI